MKKFISNLAFTLMLMLEFYVVRPVKAVGKGLTAFSNAMGAAPGTLTNLLSSYNLNVDAPASSGTVSIAAGGSGSLNAESGLITITGLNAAAGANQIVTVNNSTILATSNIVATLNNYTGTWVTDGEPWLAQVSIAAGLMEIRIVNANDTNALNGNATISFKVGQVIK